MKWDTGSPVWVKYLWVLTAQKFIKLYDRILHLSHFVSSIITITRQTITPLTPWSNPQRMCTWKYCDCLCSFQVTPHCVTQTLNPSHRASAVVSLKWTRGLLFSCSTLSVWTWPYPAKFVWPSRNEHFYRLTNVWQNRRTCQWQHLCSEYPGLRAIGEKKLFGSLCNKSA